MNQNLILIALAALAAPLLHAQSAGDPIGRNLFPPDLIMVNAEAINFTDQQRRELHETVEKNQERFNGMHRALQQETDALGKMLAEPGATEASLLTQFDKVQDREREIKRAQLAFMLDIRNQLTGDQRAKLTELRAKNPVQQPPPEFAAKIEHINASVTRWQSEGRDPAPIAQMMQQFEPLMRSGQIGPANALLDQAIKMLESGAK